LLIRSITARSWSSLELLDVAVHAHVVGPVVAGQHGDTQVRVAAEMVQSVSACPRRISAVGATATGSAAARPAALRQPSRPRVGTPRNRRYRPHQVWQANLPSGRWSWAVACGAGIMILTQLIMVAIMTMTRSISSIMATASVSPASWPPLTLPACSCRRRFLVGSLTLWLSRDRSRRGCDPGSCGPACSMGTSGLGWNAATGAGAARTGMEPGAGERHHRC
jgi:hypothetical protein